MDSNIFIGALVLVVAFTGLFLISSQVPEYEITQEEICPNLEGGVYQGAVPLGYDVCHFRETGETIKRGGET